MYPNRHQFAGEIMAEWYPPYLGKKLAAPKGVIIIAGGMPSLPGAGKLDQFLSKKGYLTIRPSYRGTWDSGGKFLAKSPHEDITDVIDELIATQSLTSLWSGEVFSYEIFSVSIIGISFGGPAALLLSSHARVANVLTLAGVVDWTVESPDEPMDTFDEQVKKVFGEGYRFDQADWDRLARGEMYQPVGSEMIVDGKEVTMIHAANDTVVHIEPVRAFAKRTGAELIELKKGGHLSSSILTSWWMWRQIKSL